VGMLLGYLLAAAVVVVAVLDVVRNNQRAFVAKRLQPLAPGPDTVELTIRFVYGTAWYLRLVQWWTHGKWSHSEYVMRDGTTIRVAPFIGVRRYSAAAAALPGARAVQMGYVTVTAAQAALIEAKALSIVGCGYDYLALLWFPLHVDWQSIHRFFCSESDVAIFDAGGVKLLGDVAPYRVSPQMLSQSGLIHWTPAVGT